MARRKAFTLLEMLVAMAMIAVLAGSLYASMRIGFSARERSEAAIEPVRAVGVAFESLGRDFACAPPPRGILAGAFTGTDAEDDATGLPSDSVTFSTRAASGIGAAPGIIGVEYALGEAPDATGLALVRRVTVNLLAPEAEEPAEEVLCRGVVSLDLRYFDGTDWLDAWDSTTAGDILPLAVEAVLGFPPAEEGAQEGPRNRRVFVLPCHAAAEEATVTEAPAS